MQKTILLLIFLWFSTFSTDSFPINFTHEISAESRSKSNEIYNLLSENFDHPPRPEVVEFALKGWEKMSKELNSSILTIIDFSLPSTEKRLWVIQMNTLEVLLHSVVSHGRNSGELFATKFSNIPESYQSSLGFYQTAETYFGKHGYSLRLDGLEEGFNDQARDRAIVIHGADYANEEFAKQTGRLGRSLGCPALPKALSKRAIDYIKDGSLLFIYADHEEYLTNSPFAKP